MSSGRGPGEYQTDVTAQQTRDVITTFDATEQPWFVWWNPIAPHHGEPEEPDDPGVVARADGVRVRWDSPARPAWVKGRFDSAIQHGAGVPAVASPEADRRDKPRYLGKLPELTPTERDALRTVTRQRAEALWVLDGQVGRTIRLLGRLGADQDTIVVFTSDNGYYLGEHLKRQGKINLHEPSIRVPLLMSGPSIPVGDRFDPVTTLDVARTLAAWGGAELAASDGIDLRQGIAQGDQGWSRALVLEGLMPEPAYVRASARSSWGRGLDTIGVRTGRWKLIRYSTGEIEVYDLLRDPLELRSLRVDRLGGVGSQLLQLWDQLSDCRGASCSSTLPADLVLAPKENRRLTQHQRNAEAAYFG